MSFDLAIEGGTVVSSTGMEVQHIYVSDGRVVAIGDDLRPALQRVNASGLLVMPGMVDTHVHLMDPGFTEREDFPSGTTAAAVAGVTTIVEHTHGAPVRTDAELQRKLGSVSGRSMVDFGLAAHAWPGMLDQIAPLWRAGATYFKAFTCATHGVPGMDPAMLRSLFLAARALDAACLVHSEEESLLDQAEHSLRAAGRDDPGLLVEWRNRDAELTALVVTGLIARRTGARVTAAHVSHADALAVVLASNGQVPDTVTETCPQYLTLLESEVVVEGGLRKFTPPARARNDDELRAMWDALASGSVTLVSSDHAPSTREQKLAGSIWDVHFGLPGLDTTLPVLLDGAHRGLITYPQIVARYAEAPARVYRLSGKGRLVIGGDADIVLVDPAHRWTVASRDIYSKAGWSPFEGRRLTGRAVATYLRGRVVAREQEPVAAPEGGRFIPGPGA